MSEEYDFEKSGERNSFFNHLLLSSEVRKLVNRGGFDSSNLNVELKINGVTVRIQDFNEVLTNYLTY